MKYSVNPVYTCRAVIIVGITFLSITKSWSAGTPGNRANPEAVRNVLSGKRRVANAAWWGFDETDATHTLQSAIDSGADRVVVPNMGKDWIIRPVRLKGEQELVLESGVIVTAKRGDFRRTGDCLFLARDVTNLTIRGYGAKVHMQKEDYMMGDRLRGAAWQPWYGPYDRGEWRHCLSLRGCSDVTILGLSLEDSGGDGIYINGGEETGFCRNIHIRDVRCDGNYRQGISVISVDGLLIENSDFINTFGTAPSAGIDIEPDRPEQAAKRIVIRSCTFKDNYGDGVHMWFGFNKPDPKDISILFENCTVTSEKGAGIQIGGLGDEGPGGMIEFKDCVIHDTEGFGLKVEDKSADKARVRFIRCTFRNTLKNQDFDGASSPLWIVHGDQKRTKKSGGIDFIDCLVEDGAKRPFLLISCPTDTAITDVTGTITVRNNTGVSVDWGMNQHGITLKVIGEE